MFEFLAQLVDPNRSPFTKGTRRTWGKASCPICGESVLRYYYTLPDPERHHCVFVHEGDWVSSCTWEQAHQGDPTSMNEGVHWDYAKRFVECPAMLNVSMPSSFDIEVAIKFWNKKVEEPTV